MEPARFDDLLRDLNRSLSRRGLGGMLAPVALGATTGLAGFDEGTAGKRGKKRRRRKKGRDRNPHICQGRDACDVGESTELTGCLDGCFCFVTANGKPICGGVFDNAATCDVCAGTPVATVCVQGGEFCDNQPFACVRPCPFQ